METDFKKTFKIKNKMNNKNSSLIGFALAGLAAGAAAWYLFGTKEGRDTLNKAVDGFNEFSHNLKDRANDGLEYAASYAEKAKQKFEQGKNQFSDATDELKDRAGQKANRLKDEAESLGRQAGHSADNLIDDANNKLNS